MLVALMLLSGLVILLRAAMGPFHFLVSVDSALTAETVFAVSLVAVLVQRGPGRPWPEAAAPRFAIFVVLALAAACLWRALPYYFISDDFIMLKYARAFSAADLPHIFWPAGSAFFRPLTSLLQAAEGRVAGSSPFAWHAIGLAIHLGNCLLVFLLTSRLFGSTDTGLLAAALFGIHGAIPEAVSFAIALGDVVSTLFLLAGLLLFWRFCGTRTLSALLASLVAVLIALWTKEPAYVFPALAVLVALRRGAPVKLTLPYWLLTAASFLYRWLAIGGFGGYSRTHATLLGTGKVLAMRVWAILAFPVNWSVALEWWLVVALALGIAGYACLAAAGGVRAKSVFPLTWILICALPGLPLLLIGPDLLNARLLYLPSIGFAQLIAVGIESLGRLRWAVAAAITLFFGAALEHNLTVWGRTTESARRFCEAAARSGPVSTPPGTLNGVFFFANGLPECIELQKRQER